MNGGRRTPFLGVAAMARLVAAIGAERMIRELAAEIRADYLRWHAFAKTPRLAAHAPGGVVELMPASDGRLFGMKYVNGHPGNGALGLQTVAAMGLLADMATGYPLLVCEMTILTALRTAATSALAATMMAPDGASRMALIGCGAQSEFQALGFRALLGIGTVILHDVDPQAMLKCQRNLDRLGFGVIAAGSADDAMEGMPVITTATADKKLADLVLPRHLRGGVHVNAIGGDCPGKTEISPDVLRRARIVVEYEPQTRIEGDIQRLEPDHPVTELHDVLRGAAPGRADADEITVFDSVGFAIEDFAAMRYVRGKATESGLMDAIDLVADPRDPRDLWSLIEAETTPAPRSAFIRTTA